MVDYIASCQLNIAHSSLTCNNSTKLLARVAYPALGLTAQEVSAAWLPLARHCCGWRRGTSTSPTSRTAIADNARMAPDQVFRSWQQPLFNTCTMRRSSARSIPRTSVSRRRSRRGFIQSAVANALRRMLLNFLQDFAKNGSLVKLITDRRTQAKCGLFAWLHEHKEALL
jgi:hypothetical protein